MNVPVTDSRRRSEGERCRKNKQTSPEPAARAVNCGGGGGICAAHAAPIEAQHTERLRLVGHELVALVSRSMKRFNAHPDAMVDEFKAARVRGALAPEEETLLPELLELHAGIRDRQILLRGEFRCA